MVLASFKGLVIQSNMGGHLRPLKLEVGCTF